MQKEVLTEHHICKEETSYFPFQNNAKMNYKMVFFLSFFFKKNKKTTFIDLLFSTSAVRMYSTSLSFEDVSENSYSIRLQTSTFSTSKHSKAIHYSVLVRYSKAEVERLWA